MPATSDAIDPALLVSAVSASRLRHSSLHLDLLTGKNIWRVRVAYGSVDLATGEDVDINEALRRVLAGLPLSTAAAGVRHTPATAKTPLGSRLNRR